MNNRIIQLAYKDSRVDRVLTGVSLDYRPEGHICDKVLTPLPVDKYSGKLGSYGTSHLQLVKTRVLDRGKYTIIPSYDYSVSTNYDVFTHGLGDIISKRDRAEIEAPFEIESDVTMGLKNLLLTEKEFLVSDMLRKASNYSTNNTETLSGNAQFSDYANSDPIFKIKEAKTKIWSASGVMATTMICEYPVLEILRSHPKLANVYGLSGVRVQISEQQLMSALGLREIIVGHAQYSNASGTQTGFWGKDIILTNRMPAAMRHQRTFGYYLSKKGEAENIYRERTTNPPGGTEILSDMNYNFMISNKDAGFLYKNAIA